MEGPRARFFFYNSMVCLLKAVERKKIRVEIRNGVVIEGTLESAESTMCLNMTNVTLTPIKGTPLHYTKFYVKGRQIRYVVIPDEVDMLKAMEWQINKTEYFKNKEQNERQRLFDRRQQIRQKRSEKAQKEEEMQKGKW